MKKVAISQSNYIPWKGYFDMINNVDEFILFDDMQFTKRDWRNRNLIKTSSGLLWLTIPIKVKGKFFQKINETEVDGSDWTDKHWKSIKMNYSKSKFFSDYSPKIENLFSTAAQQTLISDVNLTFLKGLCKILQIETPFRSSSEYSIKDGKTERLVDLCIQSQATQYISGPAAKDYIQKDFFDEAKIELEWMDYSGYPTYPQLYGEFEHGVSVIDLIFNTGPDSQKYLKSFQRL